MTKRKSLGEFKDRTRFKKHTNDDDRASFNSLSNVELQKDIDFSLIVMFFF